MEHSTIQNVYRRVAISAENFKAQKEKQLSSPIRGAALCLPIVDSSSVILVNRTTPPNVGWSLPGGRVEIDEEFETAAVRELAEETGVIANPPTRLLINEHTNFHAPNGETISINVITYVFHLPAGTKPTQCESDLLVDLFPLNDLPQTMLNLDRAKIESFLERLNP